MFDVLAALAATAQQQLLLLKLKVTCQRMDADRRLSPRVTRRRWDAERSLTPRVARRRFVVRVTAAESCTAGLRQRVFSQFIMGLIAQLMCEKADNDKSSAFNYFTVLRLELTRKIAADSEGSSTVLSRRLTIPSWTEQHTTRFYFWWLITNLHYIYIGLLFFFTLLVSVSVEFFYTTRFGFFRANTSP